MRHNPQFDLRIVGRHHHLSFGCAERTAHAAALFGADRDVLQVRVVAGQPPGNRHGLCVIGVHAAGGGQNHFGQFVGIGRFEFGQAAVLQNQFGQWKIVRQFFQHAFIGGIAAAGGFFNAFGGQPHLVEQNILQLLGRIEVERLASQCKRFVFQLPQFFAQLRALLRQLVAVDEHAVAFHGKQHLRHGQFQFLIHGQLFAVHLRAQMLLDAEGEIGVLAGIFGRLVQRHVGKRDLLRAFAAQAFVGDGGQLQPAFGQFVQPVPQVAFHNIRSQHRIARNALQGNAVVGENVLVVFHILADFAQLRVFQKRLQAAFNVRPIQLLGKCVGNGDIGRIACTEGNADADQLRLHRFERGGFGVQPDGAAVRQAFDKDGQLFSSGNGLIVQPFGARCNAAFAAFGECRLLLNDFRARVGKQIVRLPLRRLVFSFFQPCFEAQLAEMRYQLRPIGGFAPQVVHAVGQFGGQIHIGFNGYQFVGQRQLG